MHVFGDQKIICLNQNACNLSYLIGWWQDHQKKTCSLRFEVHKFVYLKSFWTRLETVHLQGPCSLRQYNHCAVVVFCMILSRKNFCLLNQWNLSKRIHTNYITGNFISLDTYLLFLSLFKISLLLVFYCSWDPQTRSYVL